MLPNVSVAGKVRYYAAGLDCAGSTKCPQRGRSLAQGPVPPGRLRTCELLPAALKLAACEGGVFPLQKGVSASSTSVRIVRCCRSSSHPVFRSVSGVIFPRVVVNWLCPLEEMSSEAAYADILTSPLILIKGCFRIMEHTESIK